LSLKFKYKHNFNNKDEKICAKYFDNITKIKSENLVGFKK